jgi:deoxycytidylate deaminase
VHISAGVQEEYDYGRTAKSGALGFAIGGGAAGTGKIINDRSSSTGAGGQETSLVREVDDKITPTHSHSGQALNAGASDQKMIDGIVGHRAKNNTSPDGTLGVGRDGDGNLTPVRESTIDRKSHAETQVLKDLEGRPRPHTVAVDQRPCPNCTGVIMRNNVDKVIVPRDTNPRVHENAARDGRQASPKTAARKAAGGKTTVTPEEINFDD